VRSSSPGDAGGFGLRADAERNRERILDAAQRMFATDGLDVPLEAIASRAGVGIATLYRRFPTRADLVAATYERSIANYAAVVDAALSETDPWQGFCSMITGLCGLQARDAALKELLTLSFPNSAVVEELKARVLVNLETIIERAKAGGRLRPDFDITDVVLVLFANAGLVTATHRNAPDAWRRLVAYLLQSFSVDGNGPLPDPPTQEQLDQSFASERRESRS
jgi:AcrR family transcriptional regulator